jgi:type VI secretion system secreted protein Hcp
MHSGWACVFAASQKEIRVKASCVKRIAASVSVAAAVLASPAAANAATDMFLKLGDIKGESQDARHKGEIDVLAWSWGESDHTGASRRNRNGLAAPDCIQDLSLTKFIDRATPDIILDAVLGRDIPQAVLTLRKAGGEQQEYLVLTLSDVTITSYSTGGSGGEDRLTENLTLHFLRMEGSYRQQQLDGSLGNPITWVISGNSCR